MHCQHGDCSACVASGRIICRCLQVDEADLLHAIAAANADRKSLSIKDLRRMTGAGDGCTACHHKLKAFIETQAAQLSSGQVATGHGSAGHVSTGHVAGGHVGAVDVYPGNVVITAGSGSLSGPVAV